MPTSDEKLADEFGEHISHGSLFLSSVEQVDAHPTLLPHAHYLQQAWAELNLAGTLCVDGRPVVYLCEAKRFTTAHKRERQRFVWNQGLVPLLVLLTPGQVEVYSGVCKPLKSDAREDAPDTTLISGLGNIAETLEYAKFIRSVETGQFFQDHRDFFAPGQAVDRCLVKNLVQAALRLKEAGWKLDRAHALLGRALFVSFLHQRGFIKPHHFPASTQSLLDILKNHTVEEVKRLLYGDDGLFQALKREFNGTMFDATLELEARDIRKPHLEILADFLGGSEMESGQFTIFSDYDFHVIPVETISAIYEEFMKEEDLDRKYEEGAFYTPRHLAETTLHIAVESRYEEAWARMNQPRSMEWEDHITFRLAGRLLNDPLFRDLPYDVVPQYWLLGMNGQRLGRLDLRFKHRFSQRDYFAFESKRLHVTYPGGKLSPEYHVYAGSDGMGGFIEGQYSTGLPAAGMLGYVMDGDTAKAWTGLATRIKAKRDELCLVVASNFVESLLKHHTASGLPNTRLGETQHNLASHTMRLFHLLLPVGRCS